MSNLQVIDEREVLGKEFRIYGDFDNPLFKASDVAKWIEHVNPTEMVKTVDDGEKLNSTIMSSGQMRKVTFLTEDGLYEVLMLSRKPIAKEFKTKVKEILRSVRKHGAYMTTDTIEKTLNDPDFIIQLATKLKEEKAKVAELELEDRRKNKLLSIKNDKIKSMQPKVDFFNDVAGSDDAISMDEAAKLLNIKGLGRNKLFAILRDQGVLRENNQPYQKHVDSGHFRIIEQKYETPNGDIRINIKTLVYQLGLAYIRNLLNKIDLSEYV